MPKLNPEDQRSYEKEYLNLSEDPEEESEATEEEKYLDQQENPWVQLYKDHPSLLMIGREGIGHTAYVTEFNKNTINLKLSLAKMLSGEPVNTKEVDPKEVPSKFWPVIREVNGNPDIESLAHIRQRIIDPAEEPNEQDQLLIETDIPSRGSIGIAPHLSPLRKEFVKSVINVGKENGVEVKFLDADRNEIMFDFD